MNCVFKCSNAAAEGGVCAKHHIDGLAVVTGQSPRCSHNVLWSDACLDCDRASAEQAARDLTASVTATARLDADLKLRDGVLRLLAVELTRRDIPNKLGPNGGQPVATHVGVTPRDGRVYRVDVDDAGKDARGEPTCTIAVCWGSRLMVRAGGLTSEVVGAVTTFFAGAHTR